VSVESATKPSEFNTSLPGDSDARSEGPSHIRMLKTVAQATDRARINSKSAAYTFVAGDANEWFYHPASDANARTWTIPANASVAYTTGTTLSFVNLSANSITIAITSDTMRLVGAGTTGSRTLAQYGCATAVKIDTTLWIITGTNLT